MVKRAATSKPTGNSISSASAKSSQEEPTQKMVLRVRQTEKTKNNREIEVKEDDTFVVKAKKSKMKSKKKITNKPDPKMPKKPPTAFFYFLEDFRKNYQEQNPNVKSMRDIGKAGGEKWKTMNYEEKVHYYDIATVKRAEFDDAMTEYIKKKESGEHQDSESDTESDV